MNLTIFIDLHDLLVSTYDLRPSKYVSIHESLAIFLWVCGGNESNRRPQNRFKHSGETISKKFDEVLKCVVAVVKDDIKPKDPNFSTVHSRIIEDRRVYPHFKDCIGALAGTHVRASVPLDQQVRYIGRSGYPSQNVLAVCDFDMRFTYVSTGQLGACMTPVCYTMH